MSIRNEMEWRRKFAADHGRPRPSTVSLLALLGARWLAKQWPWGWRHILGPIWDVVTPDGRRTVRALRELDAQIEQARVHMEREAP